MGIVVRNGEVVTASERFAADLRLEGGTITQMGTQLEPESGDETIDATGHFVLPGFIDPHVHMELGFMGTVSADDFEVGTASGVAGGTTCIIDFCIPAPERVDARGARVVAQEIGEGSLRLLVPHGDHVVGRAQRGRDARGRPGARHHELQGLHGLQGRHHGGRRRALLRSCARPRSSARSSPCTPRTATPFGTCSASWSPAAASAPSSTPVSRPSAVEGEATERALMMAGLHGATAYIVHMTCKESVHALERAKLAGQRCYGETCPQYLLLDDRVFDRPDFGGSAYVMSPPIRPRRTPATMKRSGTASRTGCWIPSAPTTVRSRTSRN